MVRNMGWCLLLWISEASELEKWSERSVAMITLLAVWA